MTRRTIPDDTVDGLKRRLRDLERGLADERRVRPPLPPGGRGVESFKAGVDSGSLASSSSGSLTFRWDLDDWTYHSPGVTGFDSVAETVSLPAGIWIFIVSLRITSVAAVSATDNAQASFWVRTPTEDGSRASLWTADFRSNSSRWVNFTDTYVFTSRTDVEVGFINSIDVAITPGTVGYFMGVQMPMAMDVIRGG